MGRKERLMGITDGDGDHGVGRPAEAGESGQGGEGASAALRLLVVQNDPESGPGTLEHALMEGGADLEFWLPFREEAAPPLDGFAGVLVFGGATNPDEDEEEPWLSEMREYVEEVVERGVPYLRCAWGLNCSRRPQAARPPPRRTRARSAGASSKSPTRSAKTRSSAACEMASASSNTTPTA